MEDTTATIMGHMKQKRQGLQSTKHENNKPEQASQQVFLAMMEPKDWTGNIFTDLCGRFLILSSQGNRYIFVMYDYNSNAILAEPMKNRGDREMIRVFNKLVDKLTARGFQPRF